MVLGEEMPLHDISNLSHDVLGIKKESPSAAGDDGVGNTCEGGCLVGVRGCSRGWQSRDDSRSSKDGDEVLGEHFDDLKLSLEKIFKCQEIETCTFGEMWLKCL